MHWTYVWNIPRALQHPTWKESFPSLQKVARSIRELLDCIYLEWVWMVQRISVSIRIKPATMASWFIVFGRILHIISQFSGLEFWPHTCTQLKSIPWLSASSDPMTSTVLFLATVEKKMKKGPWWPWTPWGIGTQTTSGFAAHIQTCCYNTASTSTAKISPNHP